MPTTISQSIDISPDFEQRTAEYRWRVEHFEHPPGIESLDHFKKRMNFLFNPPIEVRLDNLARLKPLAYDRERKEAAEETGLSLRALDAKVKAIRLMRAGAGDGKGTQPPDNGAADGKGPEPPDKGSEPSDKGPDLRPTITLRAGETERVVNELEHLLITANRGLYQRGGLIVSTGFAKMQTWDGKAVIGQVIEDRGDYALIEDAEAVAKFVRLDRAGYMRPASAPMSIIRTLKDRKTRLRLPVLVALTNCPSISADGALLDEPGFDPRTGVLFDPLGVPFPRVPERPSACTVQTALARILRLLQTFDFVSNDDRAVGLSLLFTAVARRGLPHAPLHGFDAPVAGSGKSMVVDIASILATGHEASVIAQGETREEGEKRLSAVLMRGDPLVAIDNCELPLEGVVLNQALTQDALDLRILGSSKMIKTQAKPLISATANNLIIKGDAIRRALVGRLDPKCERPELRTFDYDPIADAKQNRAELVVAVLTVLRAYHIAGRPNRPTPPLQSFVPWSDMVRGAIMWLEQGDPVKTMGRQREADPVLTNMRTILTAWQDDFGDASKTLRDAVDTANATMATPDANGFGQTRSYVHPALRDALLVIAGRGGVIDARALGQWFNRHKDRVVDIGDAEPNLVSLQKAGLLHGLQQWRVREAGQSTREGGEGE